MKRRAAKTLWLIAFAALGIFSCGKDTVVNPPAYTYRIPEQTDDGWQTASLADVGIDENVISGAIDRINYKLYKEVHGILIVKDGKLVFEEYFSGQSFDGSFTKFDKNTRHDLASVTKSFTSALIGIAIDHGLIQDVHAKVFDFFPGYADLRNDEKDKITLEHLLTMSAGLQWDEWSYPYTDSRNSFVSMNNSGDPIRYVLSRPVAEVPGSKFVYNSGLSITLGGIITNISDQSFDAFVKENLFSPLGIANYYWWKYPNGTFQTGGGLYMLPRDMAKFGYLYLNNGMWDGRQIISKEWVEQSTQAHLAIDSYWNYGYQWWLRTYHAGSRDDKAFAARGSGGQYIFVFPSLEMVVVFTGGNYSTPEPVDEILTRFILPAVL
jgi:CubicO group peptidase (beta-lactamase class C family)